MKRGLMAAVLVLPAIAVLPGCAAEKICNPGEVVIEHDGGGRSCEKPAPGDERCPAGQILVKNPDQGIQGCIDNDYDKYEGKRYTDQIK
jgi:hypothetical protein